MRTRVGAVLVALAVVVFARGSGGPVAADPYGDPAVVEQIRVLETERLQSGARGDVDADTLAPTYVWIDYAGRALDKREALKRNQQGVASPDPIKISEMVVRVYGDTAIVTALSSLEGAQPRRGVTAIRYTRVYAKEDGRWRVVHVQQTPVRQDLP